MTGLKAILDEIESRKHQTYDGEAHIISNEKLDVLVAAARERDALVGENENLKAAIRRFVPTELQEQALSGTAPNRYRDMEEALSKIKDMTKRKQLPLTSQINEIATEALSQEQAE